MMTKSEQFIQLQNDIKNYYQNLSKEDNLLNVYFDNLNLSKHTEIYYKVFFNKMSFDADILFVGINPGGGEEWCSPQVLNRFEYLDYNYSLASETKKVFQLANYECLLEKLDENNKIVKTNLYYLVTENKRQLDHFIYNILSEKQRTVFIENHKRWTAKIIELSDPKIIIYEGQSAFDESPPFFNDKIKLVDMEKNGVTLVKLNDYKPVLICYKRFRSIIKNKETFSEILKNELDLIYQKKL